MSLLYIIALFALGFIIWLIINRKWKALIGVTLSLIIIIIAGLFLLIKLFSEAFGAKCEKSKEWKIENYIIVEKRCIGFAGPYYYPFYLYQDDKEIDGGRYLTDSCIVQFNIGESDTLKFDVCQMVLIRK